MLRGEVVSFLWGGEIFVHFFVESNFICPLYLSLRLWILPCVSVKLVCGISAEMHWKYDSLFNSR